MFLILLFFLGLHLSTALKETIMFCIPTQLESVDYNTLESRIKTCLETNFIHGWNNIDSKTFLDSYIHTFEHKQTTEQLEDSSHHEKEQLILVLRDIQLKTSNNIHAIQQCGSISEKMPISIASTSETTDIFAEYKIWQHHSKKDIEHCDRILHYNVIQFQKHKIQQMKIAQQNYNEGFQKIILARNQTKIMQQTLADIREIFIEDIIKHQTLT